MDNILFTHVLAVAPNLSSGGLFEMVYEHLSGCFILEDPSSGFSKLFQVVSTIARGDILRLVALVLGVNRLVALAKDIKCFCFIVVGETFFQFISHSIIL